MTFLLYIVAIQIQTLNEKQYRTGPRDTFFLAIYQQNYKTKICKNDKWTIKLTHFDGPALFTFSMRVGAMIVA